MTNLQDGVRESEMERVSSARPALKGGQEIPGSRLSPILSASHQGPRGLWSWGFRPHREENADVVKACASVSFRWSWWAIRWVSGKPGFSGATGSPWAGMGSSSWPLYQSSEGGNLSVTHWNFCERTNLKVQNNIDKEEAVVYSGWWPVWGVFCERLPRNRSRCMREPTLTPPACIYGGKKHVPGRQPPLVLLWFHCGNLEDSKRGAEVSKGLD